mmetsp:Transcript_26243/g.55001  ORF Transcript_26243/g.55001 Transcript_26243/m.55001 type:complete len:82 (-) Transcript_26243:165-410(-)
MRLRFFIFTLTWQFVLAFRGSQIGLKTHARRNAAATAPPTIAPTFRDFDFEDALLTPTALVLGVHTSGGSNNPASQQAFSA